MGDHHGQRSLGTALREAEQHGREVGRDDGVYEGRELGHVEGVRLALAALYRVRFGTMPVRVRDAIEGMDAFTELVHWNTVLGTKPRDEVDRTICGLDA